MGIENVPVKMAKAIYKNQNRASGGVEGYSTRSSPGFSSRVARASSSAAGRSLRWLSRVRLCAAMIAGQIGS